MRQGSQKPQSSEWVTRYVLAVMLVSAGTTLCTFSGMALAVLPVESEEPTPKQALTIIFWFIGFFMCLVPLLSALNDLPINKEKSG